MVKTVNKRGETMKLNRICKGHYKGSYKGHEVEVINLEYFGDRGWIAPIDGENDIEPTRTKRQIVEIVKGEIDIRG